MSLANLEAMDRIVKAVRKNEKDGFIEVQNLRKYVIFALMMGWAQSLPAANHTYEWTLRAPSQGGTVQAHQPYGPLAFAKSPPGMKMRVHPRTKVSHLNQDYDTLSMLTSGADVIYNKVKMDSSHAEEDLAATWERAFIDAPYDVTGEDAWLGLLYWLGYSQTSGGAYVAQDTPARVGVYTTLGDGTITSTVGELDRSATSAAAARTVLFTWDGVVNEDFLEKVRLAGREVGISYLSELKGEKPGGANLTILMDDNKELAYSNLLNRLGNPRENDYFMVGDTRIATMKVVGVPSMQRLTRNNVIGIDPKVMYLAKVPNQWGLEASNTIFWRRQYAKAWSGQIRNDQPGVCGFHGHSSF